MAKPLASEITLDLESSCAKVDTSNPSTDPRYECNVRCKISERTADETGRNISIDLKKLHQLSSTAERLRLLSSAAFHLEHAENRLDDAFGLLEYALLENPANRKTLNRLESLAEKIGNWEQLCKTATEATELLSGRQNKANLFLKIGDWCQAKLNLGDRAIGYYLKVLEVDSNNLSALGRLCWLYRQNEQWEDLSSTLVSIANSSNDRAEKIQLFLVDIWHVLVRLGRFLETDICDFEKAKKCYKLALDQNPKCVDALEGLARIYSQTANWSAASIVLNKLSRLTEVPEKKMDYLYRVGQILYKKMLELEMAAEFFHKALSCDKSHRPSLTALRSIYLSLKDWKRAIYILAREVELAESVTEKSSLMIKIGGVCENLFNHEDIIYWYKLAAETDPESLEAKMSLVGALQEDKRHEESEPLLSDLSSDRHELTDAERFHINLHLATVRQTIGKEKASLEPARIAFEISSSSAAAIAVYARALLANDRLQEAHDLYLGLLEKYSNGMSHEDLRKFIYLLGELAIKLNLRSQAIEHFSRLLDEEPDDPLLLNRIIELSELERDFTSCVRYRLELDRFLQGVDKANNYVCLGHLCAKRLDEINEAEFFYLKAIKIVPGDLAVLNKLIPIYRDSERWDSLVGTLRQIAELEKDPEKNAGYYYSMGLIYRDKLRDFNAALGCFQAALFLNWHDHRSFDALVDMLTEQGQYKTLASCLKKNILRMLEVGEGTSQRVLELWSILGEIYRVHLGDYRSAATAHQHVVRANPDDLEHLELVALCKSNLPEKSDEAIEDYRELIVRSPDNENYYHSLFRILTSRERLDEAWCVAGALHSMDKATSRERGFYESYVGSYPKFVETPIDGQIMRLLQHPDDSDRISEVFGILHPVLIKKSSESLRSYGVSKASSKITKKNRHIAELFYYAADSLNLDSIPKLHFKKRDPTPFTSMLTDPGASLCGERYARECSPKELLFLAVNHLSYYRHGRLLSQLRYTDLELKTLLLAALQLGNPIYKDPKESTAAVNQQANTLGRLLDGLEKANLQDVADLFFATGTPSCIRQWLAGMELTASRLAMLLTGDLVVAVSMIRSFGSQLGRLSLATKIADLRAFSVSLKYAAIRRKLGLGIDNTCIDNTLSPSTESEGSTTHIDLAFT